MAQKFLSIKNFEIYQHYTKRNPPWIKFYKSIYGDKEFMKLSISSRYLYTGLIVLATESDNRIDNDPTWIAKRLDIPATEVDLKPLYRGGFLLASNASREVRECLHKTETETEERQSRVESASAPPAKVVPLSRASGFPDGFQFNQRAEEMAKGYGLNVHKEFAAFRDHHVAKGSVFKDWDAAFRTWLRNAVKFAAKVAR